MRQGLKLARAALIAIFGLQPIAGCSDGMISDPGEGSLVGTPGLTPGGGGAGNAATGAGGSGVAGSGVGGSGAAGDTGAGGSGVGGSGAAGGAGAGDTGVAGSGNGGNGGNAAGGNGTGSAGAGAGSSTGGAPTTPDTGGGGSATGGGSSTADECVPACGTAEVCAAGSCECAEGKQRCGQGCTDTAADPDHCGACGNVCAAGQVCSAGACQAQDSGGACSLVQSGGSGDEPNGQIAVCCSPDATQRPHIDEAFRLLNEYRISNGLSALAVDANLEAAIQGHCRHMAEHDFFAHDAPEASVTSPWTRAELCGASASGENIAYNYRSAEQVMNGWINSPGHNSNMLNSDWRRAGIGMYAWYWGQLFGR